MEFELEVTIRRYKAIPGETMIDEVQPFHEKYTVTTFMPWHEKFHEIASEAFEKVEAYAEKTMNACPHDQESCVSTGDGDWTCTDCGYSYTALEAYDIKKEMNL